MVPGYMGDDLVSLFRCRYCRARMFERDVLPHMRRHVRSCEVAWLEADVEPSDLPKILKGSFERGPADTFARPGAQVMVYGRVKAGKLGGGASARDRTKADLAITAPAEDDAMEVTDEVLVVSLDELLLS